MKFSKLTDTLWNLSLNLNAPVAEVDVPKELAHNYPGGDCELYELQNYGDSAYVSRSVKYLLIVDYEDYSWVYLLDCNYNELVGWNYGSEPMLVVKK